MGSDQTSTRDSTEEKKSFSAKVKQELKEWGATLSVFIPLFLLFSGLVYEQRVIPSESMVPNLRVGDRVAVAKFAYGYNRHSVPFGMGKWLPLGDGTLFQRTPERGDVVVFEHPHFGRVMIKRVIGLPGDIVEMRGEQLFLNGEPVSTVFEGRLTYLPHGQRQSITARVYTETMDEKSWVTHQWDQGSRGDSTPVFEVPAGHVLFMGDNRDNSKDGRDLTGHCPARNGVVRDAGCSLPPGMAASDASIGFVPLDHLIGRAETVIFSTYRCRKQAGTDCLDGRIWKGL
ncbi:MAG: signal peptidase I [Hyphomonadaceae bacterium]|nr:signal peptidase I [Hyphomonadaceae bacterium]